MTTNDAVIVHDLTVYTLADALRAHLLPAGADAFGEAHAFWDWAFEGGEPRTRAEAYDFAESLLDRFVGVVEIQNDLEPALARLRPVLEQFVAAEHIDGIIVELREEWSPDPDTDVEAWRRRWKAERPDQVRRERIIWWTFAIVATLVVAVAIVVALSTGDTTVIVIASAGGPLLAGFFALIVAVVLRMVRDEPVDDDGPQTIEFPA
jgi:hypothetical protein